jgi:hypothetical protein
MTEAEFITALAAMLVKRVIEPLEGLPDARNAVREVRGKRPPRAREDENPMHPQYRTLNRAAGMVVAWAAANSPSQGERPLDSFVLFAARCQKLATDIGIAVHRSWQPAIEAAGSADPWLDRFRARIVETAVEMDVL